MYNLQCFLGLRVKNTIAYKQKWGKKKLNSCVLIKKFKYAFMLSS